MDIWREREEDTKLYWRGSTTKKWVVRRCSESIFSKMYSQKTTTHKENETTSRFDCLPLFSQHLLLQMLQNLGTHCFQLDGHCSSAFQCKVLYIVENIVNEYKIVAVWSIADWKISSLINRKVNAFVRKKYCVEITVHLKYMGSEETLESN